MGRLQHPNVHARGGGDDPSSRPRNQKKIRGLGQVPTFRGQILSRPEAEMVEAKDQGYHTSQHLKMPNREIYHQQIQ